MADPIKVDGFRQLSRDLKRVDEELPGALKSAAKAAVEPVAAMGRSFAPVRRRTLRGTIRTGATRTSATVKAGGRRAPGAPLIHFGAVRDARTGRRRNISPDPFLYKALDSRRDEVIRLFSERLATLLEREGMT